MNRKKEIQEKRLNVSKNKTRRNKDPNVEGNVQRRREKKFISKKLIFSNRQVKKVRIFRNEVANYQATVRDVLWL